MTRKQRYTEAELTAMDIDDLDVLAFGYKNGTTVEIDPHAIKIIYDCDLLNPEEKFKSGGMSWVNSVDLSEPVELSIREGGDICLEDGHHRRFAAIKRGVMLSGVIEIKANPIRHIMARQSLEKRAESGLEM